MEQARDIGRILTALAHRLRHVVQRHHGRHAMIDVKLAHPRFPVDMGIEQSRNDEFAAEIEHLRARRHGGAGGDEIADRAALDQNGAIAQRLVGQSVDDDRASHEQRRRCRSLTECRPGRRENSGDNSAEHHASAAHLQSPPLRWDAWPRSGFPTIIGSINRRRMIGPRPAHRIVSLWSRLHNACSRRDYAVVTISLPRWRDRHGAAVAADMRRRGEDPRRGLQVVDWRAEPSRNGFAYDGGVTELFDVAVIPESRWCC